MLANGIGRMRALHNRRVVNGTQRCCAAKAKAVGQQRCRCVLTGYEADALQAWAGNGAVRLLARVDARHALLLEHCSPGTSLSNSAGTDPMTVIIALLPRIWKAGGPKSCHSISGAQWRATFTRQPCGRPLFSAREAHINCHH